MSTTDHQRELETSEAIRRSIVDAVNKAGKKFLTGVRTRFGGKVGVAPNLGDQLLDAAISIENQRRLAFVANLNERLEQDIANFGREVPGYKRELGYIDKHFNEMVRRMSRATEMVDLVRSSPSGALWKMGVAKEHTADCIAMDDKIWDWGALAIVNPSNRHPRCTCKLLPIPKSRSDEKVYNISDLGPDVYEGYRYREGLKTPKPPSYKRVGIAPIAPLEHSRRSDFGRRRKKVLIGYWQRLVSGELVFRTNKPPPP